MKFDDYQKQAITTDTYGPPPHELNSPAFLNKVLGIAGESGEVAEKIKKIMRDKDCKISETDKIEIIKELGDLLWYISAMSLYLGTPLQEVAKQNLEKVLSRKARGVTHGKGDNR